MPALVGKNDVKFGKRTQWNRRKREDRAPPRGFHRFGSPSRRSRGEPSRASRRDGRAHDENESEPPGRESRPREDGRDRKGANPPEPVRCRDRSRRWGLRFRKGVDRNDERSDWHRGDSSRSTRRATRSRSPAFTRDRTCRRGGTGRCAGTPGRCRPRSTRSRSGRGCPGCRGWTIAPRPRPRRASRLRWRRSR